MGGELLTVLAGLTVGAALSVSGVVLQGVLRNPLAEPYMLGIVGGGALFAVLAINLGLTAAGGFVLPLASLLGSLFALSIVALVACVARRRRFGGTDGALLRFSGSTIVVAGWVTGSLLGSLDMLALSYAPDGAFVSVSKWLYGRLDAVDVRTMILALVVLGTVFAVLGFFRRELNVMELGHEEAECLGVNTRLTMFVAIGAVAMATAVSVALAGAVGFVGLVVPHIVRRLVAVKMEILLPISALIGGIMVVAAEYVGRLLPGDVGVGVVCAVLGAPFFLYLLATPSAGEGRDI